MKKKVKSVLKKKIKKIHKKGSVLRTKKQEDFNTDNIFDSSTGKTNALFIPK
jgi:hypothetical protein